MRASDPDDEGKRASAEPTANDALVENDPRRQSDEHREIRAERLEEGSQPNGQRRNASQPRFRLIFIVGALLLIGLLGIGAYGHWRTNRDAEETQEATTNFTPSVHTVDAFLVNGPVELLLPAQTEAFQTASIYPRSTGYVSERSVDIGSRGKKGGSLVRIASPDL